jgi:hypothetical protein
MDQQTKDVITRQVGAFSIGAVAGAISKHASTPHGRGALAATVGSAMGAAASTGAGVGGSLAAGAGIVTAKVAAVAAFGAAVAPVAIVAGAGYGLYKLVKKLAD